MGEHVEGLETFDAAAKAVAAVRRLLQMVNISTRLRDYSIPKEDIPKLVEGGMKQARLFVPNPRNPSREDVQAVYEKAW